MLACFRLFVRFCGIWGESNRACFGLFSALPSCFCPHSRVLAMPACLSCEKHSWLSLRFLLDVVLSFLCQGASGFCGMLSFDLRRGFLFVAFSILYDSFLFHVSYYRCIRFVPSPLLGVVPTQLTIRIAMTSPAKRTVSEGPPRTPGAPAGSSPLRLSFSARHLSNLTTRGLETSPHAPAKRGPESPFAPAKRKKKKKKHSSAPSESSAAQDDPTSGPESDAEAPSTSRFEVPVLLNKAGAIRNLGSVRAVPCYECVRSFGQESIDKYPHRCYDVKHETRFGLNTQCSTCARKHVSPCVPVCYLNRFVLNSANFLPDSCRIPQRCGSNLRCF